MPKVSIIILTYNSSNYIVNLLKSINPFKEDAEVIVVDNASSDDTLQKIKDFQNSMQGRLATTSTASLGFKIIENPKNLGFAAGINAGAKSASGEYLLFINPDTEYKKGNLKDMIAVFENRKEVAIVGGKLIKSKGEAEKSCGKFFNLYETLLLILGLDEVFGARFCPGNQKQVDFLSGGLMMVRKKIFKELGGFDENFFMYVEDMEFCFRVKKNGFETWFLPSIVFSHTEHGSSSRGFAIKNIYKGILYFYKKHKSKSEYKLVKLALKFKAISIYLLGRLLNNSYYKDTYKEALIALK